ncbi:MAG: hypothetical protein SNG49_03355 [Rikenellaceae bacterium]
MINAALDLIEFLKSNFGFLFALMVYTVLAIALAKSIKKNYKVYYWIFGVISFCFIIPSVARLLGVSLPFNLSNIPFIGLSASELSSAANFIHPVLVIIMYMGALSAKNKYVGRLMSIRKELSIIVGFPVLAHAVKRVFGTFPGGWQFFFDNETYMQSPRVSSALGSGITSFAFVLGLVMTILFLVLWVTSFDSVHRKLGTKRWKSVQKWSYALYAMLFIHSVFLQLGGLISDNARAEQQAAQRQNIEVVEAGHSHGPQQQAQGGHGQQAQAGHGVPQAQAGHGPQQQGGAPAQAQSGGHSHGPSSFKFTSIEIPRSTKRVISIVIYFMVYGSYLYFRIRKARASKAKKANAKA